MLGKVLLAKKILSVRHLIDATVYFSLSIYLLAKHAVFSSKFCVSDWNLYYIHKNKKTTKILTIRYTRKPLSFNCQIYKKTLRFLQSDTQENHLDFNKIHKKTNKHLTIIHKKTTKHLIIIHKKNTKHLTLRYTRKPLKLWSTISHLFHEIVSACDDSLTV